MKDPSQQVTLMGQAASFLALVPFQQEISAAGAAVLVTTGVTTAFSLAPPTHDLNKNNNASSANRPNKGHFSQPQLPAATAAGSATTGAVASTFGAVVGVAATTAAAAIGAATIADERTIALKDQTLLTILSLDGVSEAMGGDEFAIILTGEFDRENSCVIIERILSTFEKPFQLNQNTVFFSASIGVAKFSPDLASPSALVSLADKAMYAAKVEGRNRASFADSENLNNA